MSILGDAPGAAALRQELKDWEKSFAIANGGRKAGRDDIKRDASISTKYREYNLLQRKLSAPPAVETPRKTTRIRDDSAHKGTALRERSGNTLSATPQKTRGAKTLKVIEEEQAPEPTPAYIRCALGPTPQKDGQVLGIFDMIPSVTPSKSSLLPSTTESCAVAGTPSKPSAAASPSSEPCLSRTPQSSSKRRYLEAFEGTPVKPRRLDDAPTPTSVRKLFATPSFLRRSFPLAPIANDKMCSAGMGPPLKKRGLFRSLSSMIQGMRKDEEKRMDDEWDILNELEAEENGETSKSQVPKVLVEDSQVGEMPLGPDEAPSESDDDTVSEQGALDANGRPRKVWKKKGLKRQTRRTNMRPVLHKAKKAKDVHEHENGEADEVVLESQIAEGVSQTSKHHAGAQSDSSDEGEDDDDFDANDLLAAASLKKDTTSRNRKASKAADVVTEPENKKKKMVSATAHANYRTLKIKNKNSKAKGRGGGRFGRR